MTETADTIGAQNNLDIYDASTSTHTLFRHSKREQWGLAIVLAKYDDRVTMQFQDGRTRNFKAGYYHLLDAVDRPLDQTTEIVQALRSMNDDGSGTAEGRIKAVSFDEQKAYFRQKFPDGFQDAGYTEHHRGDERKKALKRHRDALVAKAETLHKNPMKKLIDAEDWGAIHKAAVKTINTTDLVGAKERKRFSKIADGDLEVFAKALFNLLHENDRLANRMDNYVRALRVTIGEAPSWALASVLLGAVHPQEHVVVRKNVLSLQARWMAPGLSVSDSPMGILYERLAEMAKNVQTELEQDGFTPRDLLDTIDFMWATLRPMAQKKILKMRRGFTA